MATNDDKPQIISSREGYTQTDLLDAILLEMPKEIWLTKKVGREFVAAMKRVVTDEISQGRKVNLFGIVSIVPRLHTAGTREVYKEFGNPSAGKVRKKFKSKVSLRAGQGVFGTELKRNLPTVKKLAKVVKS